MTETDDEQVVRLAKSILDGSMPLILGCKQLVGPLSRLHADRDARMIAIVGVDSETDEHPIHPSDRAAWNRMRMAEKDAELALWLPKIQEQVYEACRAIIERFGKPE